MSDQPRNFPFDGGMVQLDNHALRPSTVTLHLPNGESYEVDPRDNGLRFSIAEGWTFRGQPIQITDLQITTNAQDGEG